MAEHAPADRALVPVSSPLLVQSAVMLVVMCVFLDQTIATVALPHMRASLAASPETISWVLTSFIIAIAITAPINGWMAEKLGSRNLFLGSTALFVASSAACGAASTLPAMVVFRALQGIAAGFIGPMTQTIMYDVTKPSEQAMTTSMFSTVAMVAPITGPFIGAYITDYLNWRWCFFINLPLALPALLVLWATLPARPRRERSLDVFGFAALAVALGAFQLMLDRGQGRGWFDSVETIIEAAVAFSAIWVFVVHSSFSKRPLIPRALVSDGNFLAGCLQMAVMGMTVTTISALLPTMLQSLLDWPVVFTGETMAPRGLGTVITTVLNGWLMRRFDLRLLAGIGFTVAAISTWWMTEWSLDLQWEMMFWVLFVQGLGMGLVFGPMNLIAFGGLKPELRPDGASFLNLARNVGSSVGISACIALVTRTQQVSHAELATHITAMTDLGAYSRLAPGDAALRMIDGEINRQAMMIGYLDCFKAVGLAMFAMILVPFLLKPPQRRPGEVVNVVHE